MLLGVLHLIFIALYDTLMDVNLDCFAILTDIEKAFSSQVEIYLHIKHSDYTGIYKLSRTLRWLEPRRSDCTDLDIVCLTCHAYGNLEDCEVHVSLRLFVSSTHASIYSTMQMGGIEKTYKHWLDSVIWMCELAISLLHQLYVAMLKP